MNNQDILWQTKIAARIHDPIEKALVLMRDPAGHEGGTSRALFQLLGLDQFRKDHNVKRADWWSAAADRPQWPREAITVTKRTGEQATIKNADDTVRWTQKPILINPLTGQQFDLALYGGLADTDINVIKERSWLHFSGLLAALNQQDEQKDWRKILLAFWRFSSEPNEGSQSDDDDKLGALWSVLPADSRVPDHSICDHLDIASAFAGAFAADPDGEVALLAMSIGPVQPFIAAARSTSDLWAGSHLLARLAWEAMRPVCEHYGPDAIIFPRLRRVPQVDLWLRDQMGLPGTLFENCEWASGSTTDSNPLFLAALPNRFVAVVPKSQAKSIAERITATVRQWLHDQGQKVVDRLLEEAGLADGTDRYCHRQMRDQLEGFPEVHWAVVPFSLIEVRNQDKQTGLDTTELSKAMAPFFGAEPEKESGFLASEAWTVLNRETRISDDPTNNSVFYAPNPGVLYPAIYELAERVLAAAKTVRPFGQTKQQGWRCSLTGEAEWLTADRAQLDKSYRQQNDTLWARIAARKPSWAKKGEHLSALPAIKRLWPTLFTEEVGNALGEKSIGRFVVSTHTMALAHQLDNWLKRDVPLDADIKEALSRYEKGDSVALPRALISRHVKKPSFADARRLPALLDSANDDEDENSQDKLRNLVRRALTPNGQKAIRLETYYSLILMDGDYMGRILSGHDDYAISYRDSFHPQLRRYFDKHAERNPEIKRYGEQKRASSPNRHLTISGALNDFSLTVARHVVEEEHLGRVIYAGGDDVLAMLPVADLLSAMQRLRQAYSGNRPAGEEPLSLQEMLHQKNKLWLDNGFAYLKGRMMRMMGEKATASCGAVIAHHQAPLAAVRRELEKAERRAKKEGGRDAFSITVIKRSGGALYLTAKWGEAAVLLGDVCQFLRGEGVSRRAVYNSLEWIADLPAPDDDGAMLKSLLGYQLARQAPQSQTETAYALAGRLTGLAIEAGAKADAEADTEAGAKADAEADAEADTEAGAKADKCLLWLQNFLSVAEFLARETRMGASE